MPVKRCCEKGQLDCRGRNGDGSQSQWSFGFTWLLKFGGNAYQACHQEGTQDLMASHVLIWTMLLFILTVLLPGILCSFG